MPGRAFCFLQASRTAKIALILILGVSFALTACTEESSWNELNAKAVTLYQQGRYPEAVKVAKEALKVAEDTFGPDHPAVAVSLHNLALPHEAQGKYGAAEPLYQRALAILEKAWGPSYPQVAAVLENMAALCKETGREDEAKRLEARAKGIRSRNR